MRNTLYLTWFIMSPRDAGLMVRHRMFYVAPDAGSKVPYLRSRRPREVGLWYVHCFVVAHEVGYMECNKTNYVAPLGGVIRYGIGWLWRPPAMWVKGAYQLLLCRPSMEGC